MGNILSRYCSLEVGLVGRVLKLYYGYFGRQLYYMLTKIILKTQKLRHTNCKLIIANLN